jgi:hypothetical protein
MKTETSNRGAIMRILGITKIAIPDRKVMIKTLESIFADIAKGAKLLNKNTGMLPNNLSILLRNNISEALSENISEEFTTYILGGMPEDESIKCVGDLLLLLATDLSSTLKKIKKKVRNGKEGEKLDAFYLAIYDPSKDSPRSLESFYNVNEFMSNLDKKKG